MEDIYIGVPVVLDSNGVDRILELELEDWSWRVFNDLEHSTRSN